jgi:hypothetical protein
VRHAQARGARVEKDYLLVFLTFQKRELKRFSDLYSCHEITGLASGTLQEVLVGDHGIVVL